MTSHVSFIEENAAISSEIKPTMFTELDTFVKKFHQLWHDGITAHLDLDTHAGDAWVGLRVRLGQVPGPVHSPSRQR